MYSKIIIFYFYKRFFSEDENEKKKDCENMFPFEFDNNTLISKYTGLSITSPQIRDPKEELAFTYLFNRMLDAIHFAYKTKYPLIIESPTGFGKKTSIEYFKKCLNLIEDNNNEYDFVVHVPLSNSTTIEDLFCKVKPITKENGDLVFEEIPSNFLKAINKETCKNNTFVVIENLEQASKTILESLIPVFNNNSDEQILLPNGKEINKGEFTLIATYDPNFKNSSALNSLIKGILDSSIIFTLSDFHKKDYEIICKNIFRKEILDEDFKNEISQFIDDIVKLSNILYKQQIKERITINDLRKFYYFRKETINIIDYQSIFKLLFIQRFIGIINMKLILNEFKFNYHDRICPIYGLNLILNLIKN